MSQGCHQEIRSFSGDITCQSVKISYLTIFGVMKIKILIIEILLLLTVVTASSQNYASSSLLADGVWFKLAVTAEGVYRLDYSQLKEMGFTDPSAVALYGNNQGQLSFYNDGTAPDDLRRIRVSFETGADGTFNEGDYLLFYAEGTHRRIYDPLSDNYRFLRHHYSDTAWYFITARSEEAFVMQEAERPGEPPTRLSSSADAFYRHEREEVNLIRSGREWYQQVVPGVRNDISPGFNDLMPAEELFYEARVAARSGSTTSFSLREGEREILHISVPPVNTADFNGVQAETVTLSGTVTPDSDRPTFTLAFSAEGNSAANGYIDYVDFRGRSRLVYRDQQLFISDSRSTGPYEITRFSVKGPATMQAWDITDPFSPLLQPAAYDSGSLTFTSATAILRKFVLFTNSDLKKPAKIVRVARQNLHSLSPADMIIVTHPLFLSYANQLSQLHLDDDGTTSLIVTPEQIYNEFSGGIPDAAAIRNFVKMIWERGKTGDTPLKYLLLFGDGSYENKTPPPGNTSFIPTWQSVNSTTGVLSFTSDDFYGLLDEGEGEADGYLDIGIGRLPASDTTSAGIMVRKIVSYLTDTNYGAWRNVLCLVADDEDSNLHMHDAEGVAAAAEAAAPPLHIDKIYLDSYRQVTSAGGNSYPDAARAIDDRMAAGCLIFNYVGHGNERGLAHERVVSTDNISSWKNYTRLPLFITATCEFSRFDDVEINRAAGLISPKTSAGEMVLLNPEGGAIALMSTTRVVYSAPNYSLNRSIFEYAFRTAPDGRAMRLGDIIRLAKINSGAGLNKRNFMLLGDPALPLAWPTEGRVVTDSVNGKALSEASDTLRALSLTTISGHIEDREGSLMTGFNGVVEATVYDKPVNVTTLANDGGTPMSYAVRSNVIFRGTTPVTDGRYSFSFMMPLDINYLYGPGMISYYARDDKSNLNGSFDGITVGGFSELSTDDRDAPLIRLFMNDTLFRDGGVTDSSPVLLALFSDRSGINATGAGIGHDITLWLDDDIRETVVLNSYYQADPGTHASGTLAYPLRITEAGEHSVTVRAFDNLNNPSVTTLRFIVEPDGPYRLSNLLAWPNPSTEGVRLTAGHNRPDVETDITITICSNNGQPVRIIHKRFITAGYNLPEIVWDGCNNNGSRVARGLYLWSIEAVTANGEKTASTGRLIIL